MTATPTTMQFKKHIGIVLFTFHCLKVSHVKRDILRVNCLVMLFVLHRCQRKCLRLFMQCAPRFHFILLSNARSFFWSKGNDGR